MEGVATAGDCDAEFLDATRAPKVLIAGGGIAGLVLAVALLKKGIKVRVYERDMTAIRGEGKYRGPIQIQSNALAALEAIDAGMAAEIMAEGCVTGDRINGLCDGVSGDWYVKFDTYHPAVDNGLPVTRVISRVTLQQILAKYAEKLGGPDVIVPDCKVVGFQEDEVSGSKRVWAEIAGGEREWGDVLIGADGIFSKVRRQLVGHSEPTYSGYTCYTGISDFVCPDIDTVGYRVFLGNRQYFVSSDVGDGKMQWYAFYAEDAGGKDAPGTMKQRLMQIFGKWDDMVVDLVAATPEDDVLRRDIYDRRPIFSWTQGRVALLGDSAHAMQPNLGQGGCMAIEDAYEFAKLFDEARATAGGAAAGPLAMPIGRVLQQYQRRRFLRASAIHGMARMAAIAASTYKAHLGEPWFDAIARLKIPHPGRVAGRLVMNLTMPSVLGWVLGGNAHEIKVEDRPQYCAIKDKPRGFHEADFARFMADDEALLKATRADWLLVPMANVDGDSERVATALKDQAVVGCSAAADIQIPKAGVAPCHARLAVEDGAYYVEAAEQGMWLNERRLQPGARAQLHPGDVLAFGDVQTDANSFKIKLVHHSQRGQHLLSATSDGRRQQYAVVGV